MDVFIKEIKEPQTATNNLIGMRKEIDKCLEVKPLNFEVKFRRWGRSATWD